MEITRRRANNITSVKEIGLSEFCVDTTANFSLHIPLDRIKGDAERIVDECMEKYKAKYPDVDINKDVYCDFRLIHSIVFSGEPEFSAEVIIWLKAKNDCGWPEDQSEDYEEIPVTLTEDAKQAVKRIIVKKLMENGLTE